MKIKKSILALFAAAGLLTACSDDTPGAGNNNGKLEPGSYAWLGFGVQLPALEEGRSSTNTPDDNDYVTSNGGTEIGREEENKIVSALIVLADKNNGFIAYSTASAKGIAGSDGQLTGESSTAASSGAIVAGVDGTTASITVPISANTLNVFYEKNADPETGILRDNTVRVFVFCNYPADLLNEFKKFNEDYIGKSDWTNLSCEVWEKSSENLNLSDADNRNTAVLATASGLPMSNASIATATIPASVDGWLNFYDETLPFEMSKNNTAIDIDNSKTSINPTGGPVKVERSIARLDFRDGRPDPDAAPFTYHIGVQATGDNTLDMTIVRMCLVNMSKHFYYLRRVSNNGHSDGEGFKVCGLESTVNYVVDVDADLKCVHQEGTDTRNNGIGTSENPYSKHFNFCLGKGETEESWIINEDARQQWHRVTPAEVVNQPANRNDASGQYKIWRYVTENTIPGVTQQKNGISTGIVFKGRLTRTPQTPADLADAIDNNYWINPANGQKVPQGTPGAVLDNPVLYMFDNTIYVKWPSIYAAASAAAPGDVLNNAVLTVNTEKGYTQSPNAFYIAWQTAGGGQRPGEAGYAQFLQFKKAAVDAGITIYQSVTERDGFGYYCYYYYWIRHNDNNIPGVMGNMEFAIVRNNVYKLSINNIRRIGHPRLSENDPEPITPDTPDEQSDVYLTVDVHTLPWVVRRNAIEF